MPKLNDTLVRQLAPGAKLQTHYDDDLPGFGLRVTPAGSKSFVLRYRNQHGRDRLFTIGRWDVWNTATARGEAKRLLREQVNIGVDPLANRQETREALTVGQLMDEYLKSARFDGKAQSTQDTDKGRIDRHIRPLLGNRIVADLAPDDVERAFRDISVGKTAARIKTKTRGLARVKGGEGTARRAIRMLRAIFSWGVREKLIETNPATGLDLGKDGTRLQMLDDDQYGAMFKALDKLEVEGTIKPVEADVIRVIALTGARRGEVAGLRREYVDRDKALIVLPPTRHKTGRKTGEARIIGLPSVALDIIDRQPKGEVVFPIDTSRLNKAWVEVRKAAELPADFVPHGLRHSVASHLARSGAGAPQIMTALGHRDMATSQKYIHWLEDDRKALAERAAGPALAGMKAMKR